MMCSKFMEFGKHKCAPELMRGASRRLSGKMSRPLTPHARYKTRANPLKEAVPLLLFRGRDVTEMLAFAVELSHLRRHIEADQNLEV